MPAIDHSQRVRRRVRIFGRVQGVYFRQSVVERAHLLEVDGWVRNLVDGSGEAVFEGRPEPVEQLVEFCRSGPPLARVDELRVEDEPAVGVRGFAFD